MTMTMTRTMDPIAALQASFYDLLRAYLTPFIAKVAELTGRSTSDLLFLFKKSCKLKCAAVSFSANGKHPELCRFAVASGKSLYYCSRHSKSEALPSFSTGKREMKKENRPLLASTNAHDHLVLDALRFPNGDGIVLNAQHVVVAAEMKTGILQALTTIDIDFCKEHKLKYLHTEFPPEDERKRPMEPVFQEEDIGEDSDSDS